MMNSWNGSSFGFAPFAVAGFGIIAVLFMLIIIVLKGYALWNAAKRDEKWWFIILLVVNTLGILELVYLFFVVGKWHSVAGNASSGTPAAPTNTN